MTDEFIDGLTETTEEDQLCFDECNAKSIPFTAHWENLDDSMKSFQWDSEWEKYIKHCGELIDHEGREKWLPWNIYKEWNLKWLDGYNFVQGTGDCCSMGHKNSAKASNLTNAMRTERMPREFAQSVAYAIARGNGKVNFGSGCNLNPMAKWSATKGNYWALDFGKYDVGRYVSKYKKGSEQDRNALKTQTIPLYLPSPSFDYCFAACSAGFGIHIGSGVYPTGSVTNGDGLAVASSWKSGGHAVALVAAYIGRSGKRYVFLENSHGAKYAVDSLSGGAKQWGCWMTESDIKKMATERYGIWYVNLVEMGG
jgi:hypothetical protein